MYAMSSFKPSCEPYSFQTSFHADSLLKLLVLVFFSVDLDHFIGFSEVVESEPSIVGAYGIGTSF